MAKGIIRLCYKKMIDRDSQKNWEKLVYNDTWQEFYMQSQFYNKEEKYTTFYDIVSNIPEADKLHYLVSTAAINYIRQLSSLIPDVFNAHQELCLPFKNFKFEILQSHINRKEEHKVAIYFYSEPLLWIDTINNQLLISSGIPDEIVNIKEEIKTDLIGLEANLSISSFKTIE